MIESIFEARFELAVARKYKIVKRDGERAIAPVGDISRRSWDGNQSLYVEFLALDGHESDQEFLQFAEEYGFLGDVPRRFDVTRIFSGPYAEYISDWEEALDELIDLEVFLTEPANDPDEVSERPPFPLKVQLGMALGTKDHERTASVGVRCRNLLGVMQLQMINAHLTGRRSKQCRQCGNWFQVGAGATRSHSNFCNVEHKNRYYNLQKARKRRTLKKQGEVR